VKIKALLLHWNKIMGRGAQRLAKAIEMNTSLQIFDASFNSFGSSTLNKNKKNRLSNNFK
jgi:outer membrane phospholipase A